MKVVDLETGKIIAVVEGLPGVYWTTAKNYAEYKQWCEDMEKLQNKIFYGIYN